MKRIEAIIQPHKLEEAKRALGGLGIDGITVSEVRGIGRQTGHIEVYRGVEFLVDLVPKIKLEVVVPDAESDQAIRALAAAAWTGQCGDAKMLVYDVAEAVCIQNGRRGENAL